MENVPFFCLLSPYLSLAMIRDGNPWGGLSLLMASTFLVPVGFVLVPFIYARQAFMSSWILEELPSPVDAFEQRYHNEEDSVEQVATDELTPAPILHPIDENVETEMSAADEVDTLLQKEAEFPTADEFDTLLQNETELPAVVEFDTLLQKEPELPAADDDGFESAPEQVEQEAFPSSSETPEFEETILPIPEVSFQSSDETKVSDVSQQSKNPTDVPSGRSKVDKLRKSFELSCNRLISDVKRKYE